MKAIKLTAEELSQDEGREYNPYIWEQKVESYSKYADVEFYKVLPCALYSYARYFVVYTLPEGLRLLGKFGYSSSLTSGGFQEAIIGQKDGEEGIEIVGFKYKAQNDSGKLEDAWINTSKQAREFMTERSKRFGCIFTKESF